MADVSPLDTEADDTEADDPDEKAEEAEEDQGVVLPVSSADEIEEYSFQLTDYLQEPAAPTPPLLRDQGPPLPSQSLPLTEDVFVTEELRRRMVNQNRGRRYPWGTSDFVLGSESALRATSDLGNLLGKSLSAPGADAAAVAEQQ